MQDQRDPSQPLPPNLPQSMPPQPPAYGQSYAVPQPYMQQAYPAPAPYVPQSNIFVRFIRLILRRMIYGGMIVGRALMAHAVHVVFYTLLIGTILTLGFLLIAPRLFSQSAPQPTDTRVAFLSPSSAVEEFITGQRTYDAEKMWNSFSPRFQAALLDRGASKETLAVQADNERSSGQRYVSYNYVGGFELSDGRKMFFYVVDIESPRADANGPVSYVFTVDREGKIIRVE